MDLGLKGKKALITGGSKGLGRAIAVLLAQEGAIVAIVGRNKSAVSKVVDDIGGIEQGHFGVSLDLLEPDSPARLYKKLKDNFGEVEIIVHNLGGTLGIKDYLSSVDDYQKVWFFNFGIALELNRIYIPKMQEKKWGRVVHISSSSAVMADASLAYSSAKAAVNNYVRGLGLKVAKDGIVVSAVMPGPFSYEGSNWDLVAKTQTDRYEHFISEKMAIKRLGTPEEISPLVALLCSNQAVLYAGAVLPVDGGIH